MICLRKGRTASNGCCGQINLAGARNENRNSEKKLKERDISKGSCAQSTHIPSYETFHTSFDGSNHARANAQSILQSAGWALSSASASEGSPATECPSNLITYQEEPQAGANTGDGPCDEEEKDGPEDSEERIARAHDYCFVGRFVIVL